LRFDLNTADVREYKSLSIHRPTTERSGVIYIVTARAKKLPAALTRRRRPAKARVQEWATGNAPWHLHLREIASRHTRLHTNPTAAPA
jgi:hypothetical protein